MYEFTVVLVLLGMGIIFGVALAALVVVHPILLNISRASAIEVFKPFFHKTHSVVLTLSMVVTVLALIASVVSGNWWWFGIALLMHLNGPYTLKMMMPTNRRLMADDVDIDSEETANDLKSWGGLHAVRVALNGVIFVALIVVAVYAM